MAKKKELLLLAIISGLGFLYYVFAYILLPMANSGIKTLLLIVISIAAIHVSYKNYIVDMRPYNKKEKKILYAIFAFLCLILLSINIWAISKL